MVYDTIGWMVETAYTECFMFLFHFVSWCMFMADMYKDYAVLYYHGNGVLGNKFPLHTSRLTTPEKKKIFYCV